MKHVTLTHPSGQTKVCTERAARVWQKSGWRLAATPRVVATPVDDVNEVDDL